VYTTTGTVLLLERALIFFDSVRPSVRLSVRLQYAQQRRSILQLPYVIRYQYAVL
jgi:hypothetical protein